MAEIRTRALVLRAYDQRESDRLVHLFTESQGRVAAVAKGARRSRRRFPGTLESLTVIETRLVDPPRSALMRMEGARLVTPFEGLLTDLGRYAIACELAELLDRLTGEREASPELFRFAIGVLDVLREEPADRLLALLVRLKTISRLGYRPQLAACALCGRAIEDEDRCAFEARHGGAVCPACREGADLPATGALLRALEAGIRTPLRDRAALGLVGEALRQAEALGDRFFRFHIGLELRSTPFLRGILPLAPVDQSAPPGDNAPAPARGGVRMPGRLSRETG